MHLFLQFFMIYKLNYLIIINLCKKNIFIKSFIYNLKIINIFIFILLFTEIIRCFWIFKRVYKLVNIFEISNIVE